MSWYYGKIHVLCTKKTPMWMYMWMYVYDIIVPVM